ncbi:Prophage tail fibre N-terminal [Serratia quinivorans]|uniref:GDSL-type esterase/lipase family protein n=1 Tax=Serratia quinivorans TaxID=137545 RepID=UPI00217CB50E|nr:GDSL-type esterase/lipase family protein [Serratia quinivorans]CAI1502390.1 Prophage tail fibre N-terminal [Serratia quinivorans]
MSILVEGTLLSPAGDIIGNADIVLTSISTNLVVLSGTPMSAQTDPDGRYSFTLNNGNFAVAVSKGGNNWFSGMVTVTDVTMPKSLNALILQDAMLAEIPVDYWSYFQAQTGILFTSFSKIDEAVEITTSSKDITIVARDEAILASDSAKADAKYVQNIADANTYHITPSDPDGTIAGISGTPNGKSFRVGLGAGQGFKYYVNNNGVALEISESPGADYFKRPIPGAMLDIVSSGKNKFDKNQVARGYYLYEGTGKPTTNSNYCYSDFIPVIAGSVYSSTPPQLPTSPARVTTFYDENHGYLSDISSVDNFIAPDGTAFVRVSILLTDLDAYQLSLGIGYSDYENYQDVIKPGVNLYPAIGFAAGKNLFDPDAVVNGVHLSSVGTIFSDATTTLSVSDYIAIDPSKSYACNQQWQCFAYYDASGAFISRQRDTDFATKAIIVIVVPPTAAYLRVELPTAVVPTTQIEQGVTVATEFEPFTLESPDVANGSAVQFGDVPVGIENSGLFVSGENLFNKNTVKYGYINEYGSVFPIQGPSSTDYNYSDYIPVTPGDTLRAGNTLRFVAFYGASKSFISAITNVTTSFVVPAGAAFMRVTVSQGFVNNLQLVRGAYLPTRQDYTHVIAPTLPDATPVRVPGDIILTDSLSLDFVQQGLLVSGKNLYNINTIQSGYIDESGVIHPGGTTYKYSDFIPVTPGNVYSLNLGARFVTLYAKNKAFIRTIADSFNNIVSIIADSDCFYIRVTIQTARSTDLQVEAGTTSTGFESFAYSLISELPDGTPVNGGTSQNYGIIPDSYGLERLRETHMCLNKLSYGGSVQFSWAMIGDSYTRWQERYALKCAQKLWHLYNGAGVTATVPPIGFGYRSFGYDSSSDNTDIVGTPITQTGFICSYNTGNGLDISSVASSTVGSTLTWTDNLALGFEYTLYVEGGGGIVSYNAPGMPAPVQIDLTTYAAGMQMIPLSSIPISGSGTVTITLVSGTAVLYGVNVMNASQSGVVVHKLGGSGSYSMQWVNANATRWQTAFTTLKANLVTIMLGTNDQGANLTPATFKANILTMINRVRLATPTADILLICPAENNRPGGNTIAMSNYARQMYDLALEQDVAFLNLQQSFGEKPSDYAFGSARPWMVGDGLHPDPETGGYAITGAILRSLHLPL